jgi:hypothetical protein
MSRSATSTTAKIRAVRKDPDEMTDGEIEAFMNLGRQEARLIEELEHAARNGDRNLCWEIATALCELRDKVDQECRK